MISHIFVICACLAALINANVVASPAVIEDPLLPIINPFRFPPPTYNSCPSFMPYAPFALLCNCNLAPCFDEEIECSLEESSTKYNIQLCKLQQWAAIVQNTMPDIPHCNLNTMADQLALALREEMDRQGLDFRPYPEICNRMYPMDAPVVPEPILEKRSVDDFLPDTLSPEAMETYTNNMYYLLNRALPPLPSTLNHDILQAVYKNTPPGYLALADDLKLKLNMNIQVMLSMMNDYAPFKPSPILY